MLPAELPARKREKTLGGEKSSGLPGTRPSREGRRPPRPFRLTQKL